jgi:hypothetical protein
MANPYAFGRKDYTALDRRRQLIDQTLQKTFDTTRNIAQMEKQKRQEDKIRAISDIYRSAAQDPNLTPEQKVDVYAKAQMQLAGEGAIEQAKGASDLASIYSRIERPTAKSVVEYLGTRKLPGGGRGLFYGYPKSGEGRETVTEVKQLTDKDLPGGAGDGSGGKTDEELKAAKMIEEQATIAEKAGADLEGLDRGTFLDADGKPIDPTSETGKVKRLQIEATLKAAQNQVNQIQGIMSDKYGWKVTKPTARPGTERKVVRTGKTKDGKKVVQYEDGSIEYR